ncbi:gamma-glutamyl-gamma-aminobutyrate hydrolase family protein [Desulfovibrio sp. UCD-KL4C]|uniref:gamma-glutamyl-gamma-aminobutyrate hydrolase family protein n=1 Tax=Desulfovibrio sp. UCD-KL4C TaxID=2578120 RepID=UPI0025C73969|nr:gamma-glutamyl-gamma-aminobutyrate hydrolase family protein [Desulfovibrio sp. UCD-KL4C]
MSLKIGLTMRSCDAVEYVEPRHGLALDWIPFMKNVFSEAVWTGIPNLGKDAVRHIRGLGINALILTGGEDFGKNPARDELEFELIKFCLDNSHPILGICRGMQVLNFYFGGRISSVAREKHVATNHKIFLKREICGVTKIEVNSFHANGISRCDLASDLIPIAVDEDENIEAFYQAENKILGLMWHPERTSKSNRIDYELIHLFFGGGNYE